MKTLITTISTLLILMSLGVQAEDNKRNRKKKNKTSSVVPVALFVWGNPDDPAPEELKLLKAKNALVPRAPFVWGNPEDPAPGELKLIF